MSDSIRRQHPDRIPIIIDVSKDGPTLNQSKYLVNKELSLANFISNLRKNLNENRSIFAFISNKNFTIPVQSDTIQNLYDKYKCEDGFLYITISYENCFGSYSPPPYTLTILACLLSIHNIIIFLPGNRLYESSLFK